MASSGLIEIGAHTVTHPPMTSLGPHRPVHEAAQSRRRCEESPVARSPLSPIPMATSTGPAAAAVKQAGLLYACTTVEASGRRGTDAFAIPRLFAADWDEADFRRSVLSHG